MSKRIYIAGPMRGYADFNFPAFDAAAEKFRGMGFEVINPADFDKMDDDKIRPKNDEDATKLSRMYAKRDTEAILTCTHIAMLPGWEKSTGARAEYHLAAWIGLEVLDAENAQPLNVFSRVKSIRIVPGALKGLVAGVEVVEESHTDTSEPASDNPKDAIGKLKPPLHLIPPSSLIFEALGFGDGSIKYGAYNWRKKKVSALTYIGACMRHLGAWVDGEELAPDSLVPHLGHAKACLGIIIDAMTSGNLVDDRPPPGAASMLLAKYTKHLN